MRALNGFCGDVGGGAVGALVTLPIVLSCGVVYFQGLGPAFVAAGIGAAFVSAIVAALVAGLFGGPPLHVSSPKTSHAAILSGLIGTLASQRAFAEAFPGPAAPGGLMAVCFIVLCVAALCQLLLGASRLGGLVKFVPYPVLAGIINGFALQIILGQLPNALGVETLAQVFAMLAGPAALHGWPLGLALFAGALVRLSERFGRGIPAALVGLLAGSLAYALAQRYVDAARLGPLIGQLPAGLALHFEVGRMLDFVATPAFQSHLFPIVATGITLAMISSIQSLLSMASADELFDSRHDSNRELLVQGGANLCAALLGGAPSGGSPNITRTVYANGGRSRRANLALAVALVGLSVWLGGAIARIPLAVMAGVVIVTTAGSMDRWTQQLLRKVGTSSSAAKRSDALINLAVVVLVAGLVVGEGVLAALGVGLAVIFFIFLYRSNATVFRRVMHADQISSRTARSVAAVQALLGQAQRIVVLELNGPLFFGNTEVVQQRLDEHMRGAQWVVLGFRYCPVIDTSGVMLLKRLDATLGKSGRRLLLCDLPLHGQRREYLQNVGGEQLERDGLIFADMDSALRCAEDELLGGLGLLEQHDAEWPLAHFAMFRDMHAEAIARVAAVLERQSFAAGACIIRSGTEDHALYFLVRGSVSISTCTAGRPLRLASYSAGADALFGEMALLTRGTRSAHVHADTAVTVLRLTLPAFERLCSDAPALAVQLMLRMSGELSSRLLRMTHIVRELES